MRKTLERKLVITELNYLLNRSELNQESKAMICSAIESILSQHKAYNGFQFTAYLKRGKTGILPGDKDYFNRTYY